MFKWFSAISNTVTRWAGSPLASIIAFLLVLTWFLGIPFVQGGFHNNSYQLLINTGTTIITFILVFLIQHATNIGQAAIQLKLDEIIIKMGETDNRFASIEEKSEPELQELKQELLENIDKTIDGT